MAIVAKKRTLIIASLLAAIILAAAACLYFVANQKQSTPALSAEEQKTAKIQQAIAEARAYDTPKDTMCAQVMTLATHDDTGAKFTFPTSCLAPGWTADKVDHQDTVDPSSPSQNTAPSPSEPAPSSSDAVEAAPVSASPKLQNDPILEQAILFRPKPGAMCLTVMTPARHSETGLRYTFSSSCLPDGWVADKSGSTTVPTATI